MDSGFDRVAPFYDKMMRAVFGKSIVRAQTYFLPRLIPGARVLIIGGGTGWIAQEVFEYCPDARITYLDASPKMILRAKASIVIPEQGQIAFILGNEKFLAELGQFDVLITNFFLDLFLPPRSQMISQQLFEQLENQGLWLYTDFYAEGNPLFWRKWAINGMYFIAKHWCRIEARRYWDFESCLLRLPLHSRGEKYFFGKMIKSSLYQKA